MESGPFILRASKGGCTPDASCIASYLLAAEEFTYLGCLHDEPQVFYMVNFVFKPMNFDLK